MKTSIPGFKTEVSNGTVSLIFETKTHTCTMKFENEVLTIIIDDQIVFSAEKIN